MDVLYLSVSAVIWWIEGRFEIWEFFLIHKCDLIDWLSWYVLPACRPIIKFWAWWLFNSTDTALIHWCFPYLIYCNEFHICWYHTLMVNWKTPKNLCCWLNGVIFWFFGHLRILKFLPGFPDSCIYTCWLCGKSGRLLIAAHGPVISLRNNPSALYIPMRCWCWLMELYLTSMLEGRALWHVHFLVRQGGPLVFQ